MSQSTKSVPPSKTTQEEKKVEDQIHDQEAKKLKEPPTVVPIEDFIKPKKKK